MDGCTAATHIAYALSDVATIYPITPIASMGETAQQWAMAGRKNLFGREMKVVEMESELGAAGATHGALTAGALATTFTSSQGLLLMLPNMFKISGELLPGVFHVGCRSIASHALSIFGDHQDVMAVRSAGFNVIVSATVQETMDLALVSHLAAIEGSLPVLHMFDGWRTSNEYSTIDVIDYKDITPLLDMDRIAKIRSRGMNPATPDIRGTAQNSDVYFQNREAANGSYDAFPAIVQRQMDRVAALTGRQYHLVDYVGAAAPETVMVIMGSGCEVAEEAVTYLNAHGAALGVVKIRLYRPFPADELIAAIPSSVKTVVVMDRTKEPGAQGEPLYQDVATALLTSGRTAVKCVGGRYGLGSKDFNPSMVKAVMDAAVTMSPGGQFTVGITDDVTRLSVPVTETLYTAPEGMRSFIFYGMGSDGTVGATRQAARIVSELSGEYAQAYFEYSAKKSGGYTVSSLRLHSEPIRTEYAIEQADYVGCNKDTYVHRFRMAHRLRHGGTFVINTPWTPGQIDSEFPADLKRRLAQAGAKLYCIDAASIAAKVGLGVRINVIMETVFLKLCGVVDFDKAVESLRRIVTATYAHEGGAVVAMNMQAIDMAVPALKEVPVPSQWLDAAAEPQEAEGGKRPEFIDKVADPCLRRQGDSLPVSVFTADGFTPVGTTAYEKRRIALNVPQWDPAKCIQCTLCSLVCAHAAIRPYVLDGDEKKVAPADCTSIQFRPDAAMQYRIQVYTEDCTGCGSCAVVCPGHALTMMPLASQMPSQIPLLTYLQGHVSEKTSLLPRFTVRGSQLQRPLLEFSGACAGCGETPYVKLLTQLFGERMVIANATGCSSIWGANYPSMAYCVNAQGRGPAWANSLFEDNAEFGMGIATAFDQLYTASGERPSVWAIGGDGWAYDIGAAGLDHVLAQNLNINILVMDTQCYSNTGGQESKATPLGAVVKYAPDGKRTVRKDLGRMAMTYGHVYVASISLGFNPQLTVQVLQEAEAYPGPSLIIAYCPCINHGIRAGMSHAIVEMRNAVKCGYWPVYHYNPQNADNPLTVDYQAPDGTLVDFINGEDRYADLKLNDAAAAAKLQPELAAHATEHYDILTKLQK